MRSTASHAASRSERADSRPAVLDPAVGRVFAGEVRADALARRQCKGWWWHAPRSRCLGTRVRTFRHGRLRMAIGLGGAAVLVGLALLRGTGTWTLVGNS